MCLQFASLGVLHALKSFVWPRWRWRWGFAAYHWLLFLSLAGDFSSWWSGAPPPPSSQLLLSPCPRTRLSICWIQFGRRLSRGFCGLESGCNPCTLDNCSLRRKLPSSCEDGSDSGLQSHFQFFGLLVSDRLHEDAIHHHQALTEWTVSLCCLRPSLYSLGLLLHIFHAKMIVYVFMTK